MRKLTFLLACSMSAVFAASPGLVIHSQYSSGRDRVVEVRNDAEIAVTAFLLGTSETATATTDVLLGAHDGRSLHAGETAEVRIPNGGAAEARVMAVIFEDGSSEGDSRSIGRLLDQRRDVSRQVNFALTLLRNENVYNYPAATVANWFRHWRERWQADDPNRDVRVAIAAESYFGQAGNASAVTPARDLTQALEQLSAKLTASRPAL